MKRKELIRKYLDFFKDKKHKETPNESLIPENDPSALFISAGMHPLAPYLLGQEHPLGKRLCSLQKCIRTGDIDEVGDTFHHTFFEMLGNWSLGDYWKKESINFSFEFLTKVLKIPRTKLHVTCFRGDKNAPKDTEAEKIWKSIGINKIKFLPKSDNWWGPAGTTGPCGPDTEIFVNALEIWNNVFMQYNKTTKGKFEPLKQKNVDTGMGVERTIAILNNLEDDYMTNCFKPIIEKIEKISGKKYKENEKSMRIIADHIKAAVFIIADGIAPSNTEQGYILRRLIRRAIRYGRKLNLIDFTKKIAEPVFEIYSDYKHLQKSKKEILEKLKQEEQKFNQTLQKGLNVFEKVIQNKRSLGCKESFLLYQSYGFPLEMIEEECETRKIKFSRKGFEKECKRHQELSRTASAGKFKSGLADNSDATTKLHTASHLLLSALRKVLKNETIYQKGSNITAERLRLDFSFPRKLTEAEISTVERLVNQKINEAYEVCKEEMSLNKARKEGASGVFDKKYGEKVSVYSIGNFSKEICAGPHVKNTCELGKFKITKQESVGEGARRIKAVLDQS